VRNTNVLPRKYGAPPLNEKEEEHVPWRRGFIYEREGVTQAASVSVYDADGRGRSGFSMSLYLRYEWLDRNPRLQKFVLLFDGGAIYMEGQYMERGADAAEEGKLKRIQEHDAHEVAEIKSRNADVRKREDKEPVIFRVIVSPPLSKVLEEDPMLAEVAGALKEDYAHHAGTDKELA
jgi:hypothetical protein